jgi:hypothetical protein
VVVFLLGGLVFVTPRQIVEVRLIALGLIFLLRNIAPDGFTKAYREFPIEPKQDAGGLADVEASSLAKTAKRLLWSVMSAYSGSSFGNPSHEWLKDEARSARVG